MFFNIIEVACNVVVDYHKMKEIVINEPILPGDMANGSNGYIGI